MKFNCDARKDRRASRRLAAAQRDMEWHKVFAWLPHKVDDGDCRFLETVERRLVLTVSLGSYLLESRLSRALVACSYWEYRSVRR